MAANRTAYTGHNKKKTHGLGHSVRMHLLVAGVICVANFVALCIAFAAGIRFAEKRSLAKLPTLSPEARDACLAASGTGGCAAAPPSTTGLASTLGQEAAGHVWDKDSGVV